MTVVAHTIIPYLFKTGSWIYNQLINSETARHIVLTSRTENLGQFSFDPVYSLDVLPKPRQFFEKGYRKVLNRWYPYWLKTCRREKVNILHSHFGQQGVLDIPLAGKLGIPHVVSFYGADMSKALYYRPQLKEEYKILFDKVSAVIVEGNYAKRKLVELGCPEEKVHILHLGVNLSGIKLRKRNWKPGAVFKILLAGTFTQKKGLIIALKAINQILIERPEININISLVGDSQPTTESMLTKKEITDFVEQSILKPFVSYYGYIPYNRIIELSYSHHLFIQPSIFGNDGDSEGGFPVIITDMLSTGMPVIGSDHCDIPEIIKNGHNGFIVKQGDAVSLKKQIIHLMDNYAYYIEKFIQYNKAFLNEQFNMYNEAKARESLYSSLLNKKAGHR